MPRPTARPRICRSTQPCLACPPCVGRSSHVLHDRGSLRRPEMGVLPELFPGPARPELRLPAGPGRLPAVLSRRRAHRRAPGGGHQAQRRKRGLRAVGWRHCAAAAAAVRADRAGHGGHAGVHEAGRPSQRPGQLRRGQPAGARAHAHQRPHPLDSKASRQEAHAGGLAGCSLRGGGQLHA